MSSPTSIPVMNEGERVEDYLRRYERNELLRFLTCGTVESTLRSLLWLKNLTIWI